VKVHGIQHYTGQADKICGTPLTKGKNAESFEMEGMLGNWEGKKENEPVSCPNCKWDGLESDLHYANQSYYCPECKRKDWEYIEFNAEEKKLPPLEKMGQAIVDDFCDNFNIWYWTEKGRGRDYGFASLDLWMDMDVPPPYYYTELEGQRLDEMEWLYKGTGSWGKEKYKPNNRYKEWVKKIKKKYPMFSKMKFIPSYGSANPDTCDGPQSIETYVLFDSPDLMAAESKKLPPVEKAIDTGIASGATMEGLDLALAGEMFECQDCDERCHICGTGELHEHIIDCEVCNEPFCRKRCWGCGQCEAICERCEGQCPTHIPSNEIMEYDRENPLPDKPYSRTHRYGSLYEQYKDTGCITYWDRREVCAYCKNVEWTKANKDYEQYLTWKNANRKREQFIRKAEGLETLMAAETFNEMKHSKWMKRYVGTDTPIWYKIITTDTDKYIVRMFGSMGGTEWNWSVMDSAKNVLGSSKHGDWTEGRGSALNQCLYTIQSQEKMLSNAAKGVVHPTKGIPYSYIGSGGRLTGKEVEAKGLINAWDELAGKYDHVSMEKNAEWADEHSCEHCGSTDIDYGNNWKCHDCGRYAAEEQSVYYWVKTEMENRHPITQSDLEQLLDMISFNVPLSDIEFGIAQAEEMGDEPTYIILELARQKAKFIKKYQAEEYTVADEDWAGQSCEDCYEEIKLGDSVHDDDDVLICKKCYSNYKIPCEHEACDERFKNKEEEEEHRQETCHNCDGEGWIVTHYTPATYHDPADVDGEDCDECGGEGWVCDKFNAESFSAEEMCLACNSVNQDPETHAYCETCRVKCVVCGELLDEDTDGENYENKICGTVSCYEEAGIIPEWMGNSYYANDYLQEFPAEVLEKYGYGAESNGDLQLDESKKRTKMSAIRTGLAITTFGIVLWNLWTNKKQESQISDIMDLV